MRKRPYFILAEITAKGWCIQFGDYDRSVVTQERRDYADSYRARLKDLRVIKAASARQADCDAAIAALNAV